MDAERWLRIKEIHSAALDKEGADREAYLAEACGGESGLAELLRVLTADATGEPGFLDDPSSLITALISGNDAPPARVFATGEVVAERFTISRYIARGGMGEVYEAVDSQLGERVALKTIRPEIASDAGIVEQFKKEVRRSRLIASRHVCRVHDFYTHRNPDGSEIAFFSMKLLDGATLAERLRNSGPLSAEEALAVAQGIAEGLRAAHQERIVHGDLKTGNVLLTRDGAVITDFGLARRVPRNDGAPESDVDPFRGGTPAYMAPEQVEGGDPTPASDIYSFGLVLYEAVTGRLPFQSPNNRAVAAMRLKENPASPRSIVPDLPLSWEQTILRCLEREPAKRFERVDDVIRSLEALGPDSPSKRDGWRRVAIPILLLCATAGLGSYALWNSFHAHAPPNSVAILPFENLGGSPDQEYFSDAFTDELTNELMRATRLRVMGRDSSARFKKSGLAPVEVGRHLGVQFVLTGSVQRGEGQLRMIARLVNVSDGFQVWSRDYARNERDMFMLRNQIAREVGAALHASLALVEEPQQLTPAGLDVRDLYWMGRFYWKQRTQAALLTSVNYFQQAIDKDPGFALAYSGLADAYCVLAESGAITPAQALASAKQAALSAVSLNRELADGYVPLGQVASLYDRDFVQAERYFRRAIELDPKLVSAHQWYSYMLVKQRRFKEALEEARLALEFEPLSLPANINLAVQYWYSGDDDRTVQQCRKLTQLDDRIFFNHLIVAEIFGKKGLVSEAMAELERVRPEAKENPLNVRFQAELYAILGRRAEAEERIRQLVALRSRDRVPSSYIAAAYASVGDNDQAFKWLERAFAEHDGFVSMMDVYPAFAPIRSDPRYRPMLERLGITGRTGSGSGQVP